MFRSLGRHGLTVTLICLGSAIAIAQEKAPRLPQPAPEMSQLGFFVGTFECRGEAFSTPMSERHPIERTIAGKMDLDGHWLFVRFEDMNTQANPTPIRGNWQLTYDAKEKSFLAVWTDNLGRWFPQTSAGWKDGTIAFTGEFSLNNQKAAVRDVFTRKSEREMIMTVEIRRDGEWMRFLEFNCAK
jgi:hypothetical protein